MKNTLKTPVASTRPEDICVCVVGMWHLGLVTAICLAEYGYEVVGVDQCSLKIENLKNGVSPIFEPRLDELLIKHLGTKQIEFTSDLPSAVRKASHVWIAFDVAVDENDESDLSLLWETTREIAPHLGEHVSVLVSSQVPVGTCEQLWKVIQRINPNARGGIAYVPENLRLGFGIERFQHPDMIVIGADDDVARSKTEQLLQCIEAPKISTNLRTAEMAKHAINAFLATTISFINEFGALGDLIEVDTGKVGEIMRLDSRIGPKARLTPGLGFAGGTLARDLRTLQKLGRSVRSEMALVDAVLNINSSRNCWLVDRLRELQSLEGARIGVLGLTYAPNTSTMRRSAALEIIKALQNGGAKVKAYDPRADLSELTSPVDFEVCVNAYAAATECDALLVLTDWAEFSELDFVRLGAVMRRKLLIDAKNLLDQHLLIDLGFEYVGIGRGHFAEYRRHSS